MRLTIFGASGQTGRHLVGQALDAGHTATAVVRDPTRLPLRHQRLQVLVADVLDPAAITAAVAGADAVLSTLGPTPTQSLLDHVGRHRQHPGRHARHRHQPPGDQRRPGGRRRPRHHPAVSAAGRPVAAAAAGWPVRRHGHHGGHDQAQRGRLDGPAPALAVRRPRTGTWRRARDGNLRGGARISRADLAAAMLASVHDPDTVKATIDIGY